MADSSSDPWSLQQTLESGHRPQVGWFRREEVVTGVGRAGSFVLMVAIGYVGAGSLLSVKLWVRLW